MLLIPSNVFLVESDAAPPISNRTAGPGLDILFVADPAPGGQSCFGFAPGSSLELGASFLSLTVTAAAAAAAAAA